MVNGSLNVRVRKVTAGVAGASGLLALGGSAGCAVENGVQADEVSAATSSAVTVSAPGSATLNFQYSYGANGTQYRFNVENSTTDEFLRVGETLTFKIPGYLVWSKLHPESSWPEVNRAKAIRAEVKAIFYRDGQTVGSPATATTGDFQGSYYYDLEATTGTLVIPAGVDAVGFELLLSDNIDSTLRATFGNAEVSTIAVFAGELPRKTVLFDNNGGTLRSRVVEGGQPVRGADVLLGYTDWRANTLVDSFKIDREIGNHTSYGRFGSYTMPMYGELTHEVSYAVAYDDNWNGVTEKNLGASQVSILAAGQTNRTIYSQKIQTPSGARKMSVYFHVKTYLVVDYSRYSNIGWRKYNQGDRILVRERWDNPSGTYSNYEFALEQP